MVRVAGSQMRFVLGTFVAAALALVLSSCSDPRRHSALDGSALASPSQPGPTGPSSSGSAVTACVIMGAPVANATVSVFLVDTGSRTLGRIATGTTDASGHCTVQLTGTGPFLVLATGGTFTDDATGSPFSLGSVRPGSLDDSRIGVLEAFLGSASTLTSVNVTPLTTIASRRVCVLTKTDSTQFVETQVALTNQAVCTAIGIGTPAAPLDPRSVLPLDFQDATQAAAIQKNPVAAGARYGSTLSGLSQQASTSGVPPLALVDALSQDFTDGAFDGMTTDSTGSSVPVPLSDGSLSPTAATSDLKAASLTFLSSPSNASGVTPAAVQPQ